MPLFKQKASAANDKNNRTGAWRTVDGKEKQSGSFSTTGKFIPARNYRFAINFNSKIIEFILELMKEEKEFPNGLMDLLPWMI